MLFYAWTSGRVAMECWTMRKPPTAREQLRRLRTLHDCVLVLQLLVTDVSTTDELVAKLIRLYADDKPSEYEMRALSLLQQRASGTCGFEDFAATTLWLCAQEAIMRAERCPLRRSWTFPLTRIEKKKALIVIR